mgnify:CR=1 FL=1
MVLFFTIIAAIFTFYTPLYLKKKRDEIKPTQNIFNKFVENDHGYPWSIDTNRKKSYEKELAKRNKLRKNTKEQE